MSDPWEDFKPQKIAAPDTTADPWAEFAPKHDAPISWADVPIQAMQNAPSSAVELAKNIIHPVLHPYDTAKSIFDVGYGFASKADGALGGTQDPEQKAKDEATVNAIGKYVTDRYGSVEGLKHTLAHDPVGFAADLAGLLTGGGALAEKAGGKVAQIGQALSAAGSTVDPLRAAGAAAGAIARHGGSALAELTAIPSGVGGRAVEEAFNAGRTGNQAFTDNMRGAVPLTDIVDMAKGAHASMRADNSARYRANMDAMGLDLKPVTFDAVQTAIDKARDVAYHKGIVKNAPAATAVEQMQATLDAFQQLQNPTAADLDALKQAIQTIHNGQPFGSPATAATGPVFEAARRDLIKQSPDYATAMGEYGAGAKDSKEVQQAFSLNGRASDDTVLRKLTSVLRNNVNTNFGARAATMDTSLVPHAPDLVPAIAGQVFNTFAPRGLGGKAVSGVEAALAMSHLNPLALAALPFSMPRVVGEGANALGRGYGAVERAFQRTGIPAVNLGWAPNAARGAYAADSPQRAQEQYAQSNALMQRRVPSYIPNALLAPVQ